MGIFNSTIDTFQKLQNEKEKQLKTEKPRAQQQQQQPPQKPLQKKSGNKQQNNEAMNVAANDNVDLKVHNNVIRFKRGQRKDKHNLILRPDLNGYHDFWVINDGITRFEVQHDCMIAILEENQWIKRTFGIGHAAVCVAYFVNTNKGITCRIFMIELFTKGKPNEKIFSIHGPLCGTRQYKLVSNYYCFVKASMDDIISIAKLTIEQHGDYDLLFNNCRHYTRSLLNSIKLSCKTYKLNLSFDIVYKYMEKYPPDPSCNHTQNVIPFEALLRWYKI
eukprot:51570_1